LAEDGTFAPIAGLVKTTHRRIVNTLPSFDTRYASPASASPTNGIVIAGKSMPD
jgi:hypothetical protein